MTGHEFTLPKRILDRALESAPSKHIVRGKLLIGCCSDEREDSIRSYWKDLAKGSGGEGAKLHFDQVSTGMKCVDCSGISYIDENEETGACK